MYGDEIRLMIALSLLSIALMFGCYSADDGQERCELNSDCASDGQRCVDGRCLRECVEDIDCDDEQICSDAICTAPIISCRADSDCPYGNECAQGICAVIEGFCLRNNDCRSGQVCSIELQRCVDFDANTGCQSAEDCFAGDLCVQGQCTPPAQEQECTSTGDCFAGEICENGDCVAEQDPECVRNSDCRDDLICIDGDCLQECEDDRDCDSDERCTQNTCEPSSSNGTTGMTSNGTTASNVYGGPFRLSSNSGIKQCNANISIQYEARNVTAIQNDGAYTFIFPTSVYDGWINGATFSVSWSGLQQSSAACGEMNSANTYTGTFSSADLFQGTLTTELFFQVGSCDCVLTFPITGTRQ